MKDKIIRGILYGGISKEDYDTISPTLRDKNKKMLRMSAALASIIMLVLFVMSFVVSTLASNRALYASVFGVMVIFLGLSFVPMRTNRSMLFICYGFLLAVFAFAIILGTFLGNTMPATSFCVLIFALPLLFVGKPYRLSIVMIISTVAFIVCSKITKAPNVASLDMVNGLSFLFLAIIVNYYFLKTKMRDVFNQTYIAKERDTDGLTGLLTKVATKREIEWYLEHDKRPGAMLVIDIDNFKAVNDTMGHAFGDAVIRIMGTCIKGTFRDSDVLGRFGGDEFVLFIKGVDDKEIIRLKVEDLVSKMNESFKSKENLYCVTGSIGICIYPQDGSAYDDLFNRADEALYESKRLGKNRYQFYFDKDFAK